MSGCERRECGICLRPMRRDSLKRHMFLHGIFTTYQEKHKCMYCNYTSDKVLSVRRHIGTKHQEDGKVVLAEYGIKKYLKPMTTKDIPTRPSVIVANPSHISPPPPPPSPVAEAEPELINSMSERNENARDNGENYTPILNVIYRDIVKVKHKKVNCRICHRVVGSNNMKKHMKQHGGKATSEGGIGKMKDNSRVDEAAVENSIVSESNEYKRKLELEGGVKQTDDVKTAVWRP